MLLAKNPLETPQDVPVGDVLTAIWTGKFKLYFGTSKFWISGTKKFFNQIIFDEW